MKKLLTLFYALILLQPQFTSAQNMQKVDSAQLSVETIINSHWLDIDNNAEHELILQSNIGADSTIITTFNWENLSEDSLTTPIFTAFPIGIEDLDNNNQLDIIGFTRDNSNQIYLSVLSQIDGQFEIGFQEQFEGVQQLYIQDWNKDGLKDILLLKNSADSLELSILKNSGNGFNSEPESLITLSKHSQINFLDINQNGRMDILVTSNESNVPITPLIYSNHIDSIDVKESKLPQANYNSIGLGDYNHDGKLDFFSTYKSNNDDAQHAVFINDSIDFENYILIDSPAFEVEKSFLADFNADGLTDIFIMDSTKSAIIYQKEEEAYEFGIVSDSMMLHFNFYDQNRDGKLDMSSISEVDSTGNFIYYWENKTLEENSPPYVPSFHIAFQTAKGVAIVWNDSDDDHTAADNITYDVFLGKNSFNTDFLAPNFDINNSSRLKTMRGNNYYGNELKFDSLPAGTYSYGIQPIDNSLVVAIPEGSSGDFCPVECGGRYIACGEFEICESITENLMNTCIGKTITLGDSSVMRYWYSEQKGFLGTSDTLTLEVSMGEIIYARDVDYVDCGSYQSYKIQIIDESDFKIEDIVICEAEEVALNFPQQVDSLKWFSATSGFISNKFSTSIFIEKNELISFEAYLNGCLIEGQFSINIDNSKVEITNNTVEIKRGGSVQLNAIGAAEYEWNPSQALGQNNISNPVASPQVTTKFTVKGVSALGCVTYDSVEVKVLQEAFIPELFTPNGDSKNDNLRIYGLVDVAQFEFIIYDREGNIVFKTNNHEMMNTSGWDGSKAGSKAEAGIYFWQVRGSYSDGAPIQLNGNQKGKVLLSK
ncbi:FG-GAP-like repeat-containing protein [Marivirga salinae]|uniref:FG-GAP-like repeat-containing protein n=1 Tax=Marivirga salinarum TaxID=3059078 RepID=A0AA51NE09_9BACT|nr:FG-GAP-like repeat-containing protein [Marivirga sp. BDSF4-3]WMN12175.1 FG-GAP-like repeat-containing protein [Marivirga sp. BDSF4-3]